MYFTEAKYWDDWIFKAIYCFHMPIFAVLSGYCFYYSCLKHSTISLLKEKVIRLILPIFSWTFLYPAVRVIKHIITSEPIGVLSILTGWVYNFLGSFWFLWAMFYCSIFIIVIRKVFKDSVIAHIIFWVVSFMIPNYFNSNLYIFMLPFFVTGYLWNKYNLSTRLKKMTDSKMVMIVSVVVWIVLLLFYKRSSYIYNTGIYIFSGNGIANQLRIDVYRIVVGFAGIAAVMPVVKTIYDKFHCGYWLTILGKETMGIYILNQYGVLVLLRLMSGASYNILLIIVETIVQLVVMYPVIKIIERFRFTRRLLFGMS